jgi:hypothetical protein
MGPYHPYRRPPPEHPAVELLQGMKTTVAALALGILVVTVTFYRSCSSGRALDVDPHARKEIEKARQK